MHYDCDHVGFRVYAVRTFSNGSVHHCVQCLNCLHVVKMEEHQNRPWIRKDEIPSGFAIHTFLEPGQKQ